MSQAANHDPEPWRTTVIPASTPPVAVRGVPGERGLITLVRFPQGWSRPGVGHYPVWEEFLVLSGELIMNGWRYRSGDYAYLPAFHGRRDSMAAAETLAIARFGGRTPWIGGEAPVAPQPGDLIEHRSLRDAAPRLGILGVVARRLRDHGGQQTWYVEHGLPPRFPVDVELLTWDAGLPRLARVPAGTATPALGTPVLVRTG